ncbi:MAG: CPBP family intramembrane metalloprotease [Colwellia sp.]|nr:CPBP family intramembrane metalloprotease [Colwellia sp.]
MMDTSTLSAPTNVEPILANENPKQPAIKKGWLRAIIGAIVISLFSGFGVIPFVVSGAITPEMLTMPTSELFNAVGVNTMLTFMLSQFLCALFALYLFRKFIDKKSFKSLGFELTNYKADLLKGLVWGVALISLGFFALYFSGFITVIDSDFGAIQWLSYIAFFAIVAFNEEILVRGYVLTNLMASINKYWALIVSALLFSVMHLGNDSTSFISTVNLFIAGLMLGIYTIHKRNLWFPIAMHFTWNFFQGPVLGFEVSGIKMESVINQQVSGNPLITGGDFGFEGSLLLTVMMIASTIYIHMKYKSNENR